MKKRDTTAALFSCDSRPVDENWKNAVEEDFRKRRETLIRVFLYNRMWYTRKQI